MLHRHLNKLVAAILFGLVPCAALAQETTLPDTAPLPLVQPLPEMELQNVEVLSEQDQPAACFVFSQTIDPAQRETLPALVDVKPADGVAFRLDDTRLCLDGLSFGQNYDVIIHPGFRGEGTQPTSQNLEQTIEVPDRTPALSFSSSGYVLPRLSSGGIPLRSVNIDSADVAIYRINDRNLISQIGDIGNQLPNYDLAEIEQEHGEKVYEGTLAVHSEKNQWTTTQIPVADALKERKAGVYIAVAKDGSEDAPETNWWDDLPTQWFVISDLGLSAFRSDGDGLAVIARSLDTANVKEGISLTLLANNNSELATTTTGKDGVARFEAGFLRGEGGNSPAAVYANDPKNGDFTFLSLIGGALDLTDRGAAGRYAGGALDAYVVTERGIYRPGETVYATAIVRDASLNAITNQPLTLQIIRPDGKEALKQTLKDDLDGGYAFTYATSTSDQSGQWELRLYTDINLPPIGSASFILEDFQPPRLEIDLKDAQSGISPDGEGQVAVTGRFLYGAPAAALNGKATLTLRTAPQPFPDFNTYSFGLVEESFLPVRAELPDFTTDTEGNATVDITLGDLPDTSYPLQADVSVSLFDVGGRPVSEQISLPVQNLSRVLGIRPDAAGYAENTEAGFDVVMLDGTTGQPLAEKDLSWTLYQEDYDYIWYRSGSGWDYEPVIHSLRVGEGKLDTTAAPDAPAHLVTPVQSGYYRLEVRGASGTVASSVRFVAGWRANPSAINKPDAVSVTRDETAPVKPGETLSVHIAPPYDAGATVVVADSRLRTVQTEALSAAGTDIKLNVPKDAAGGFYVLVSAVQKRGQTSTAPSRRAMGVLWVPLDPTPHQLSLDMTAPELVRPNTSVPVELSATGMESQQVHVVLAAVDDGVLGLTDYESPNPSAWYLGQRWLAVSAYDVYASLIDSGEGEKGELREGGDTGLTRQLKNLPQQITKIAALYSGIVTMKDGKATITLDIPDFNGRLRLMAFAWTSSRTGQTDATMLVRAPLVADLMLPRFLAPDDTAEIALSLDNRDAPAGDYTIKLEATGAATLLDNGEVTLSLAQGERRAHPLRLHAMGVGEVAFQMKVQGPEEYHLTRDFNISVRSGSPSITRKTMEVLAAGQSSHINPVGMIEGMLPGTEELTLALSPLPELDVPALLKAITRYPYGCMEQTTSTAMPLLYVNDVATEVGLGKDAALRSRIQKAITRLESMQRRDGGYGLWGAQTRYDIWLSAYVMDFLTRARSEGYLVSEETLTSLSQRLSETVRAELATEDNLVARAYAFYILARNSAVDAADVRYFSDTWLDKLPTKLARVQITAALKLVGDETRTQNALTKVDAPRQLGLSSVYDYGSDLRDAAAVLTLMAEHKLVSPVDLYQQGEALARWKQRQEWLSTQEEAWLLLAAHALIQNTSTDMDVQIDKERISQRTPYYRTLAAPPQTPPLTVENKGQGSVYQIVTMSGIPLTPQPEQANGFRLTRSYYRMDGTLIDLASAHQNDLVVVVLNGTVTDGVLARQALVVDMLPAGFELEKTPLDSAQGDQGLLKWLAEGNQNLTTPVSTELRADRYVAALDLYNDYSRTTSFRLAYIMRAVTVGTFAVPGAQVEDMYNPSWFGRTGFGTVTITPAQ